MGAARPFKPDYLWNYEIGAKGRLWNGLLDYQLDAYSIVWKDIQVQETTADGAFNFTGNAGKASVQGVEFEFDARPLEHLTVNLAGSYQDAYLTKGATPAEFAANPTLGLTGERIPDVARFQFNLGLNYTTPLGGDWSGTLATDVSYRGNENSYFESNPFNIALKSYTLAGLRFGVSKGPWTTMLFARNLTDERAQVSAVQSALDTPSLLTVRPRTIGISVTRTL